MHGIQEYLYKYRSIDPHNVERSSRVFTHNEVYFSHAGQFNDPFDCKYSLDFSGPRTAVTRYFNRILKRRNPNWGRAERRRWMADNDVRNRISDEAFKRNTAAEQREIVERIGIYSLSRVRDDILMWSHYADSHRGYCLQFIDDTSALFMAMAQEVIYSDDYPVLNPITQDSEERLRNMLLTKSSHWAYEREWRAIDHEAGPGLRNFRPDLLTGVIFGCAMSTEDEARIVNWCANREHPIAFSKAKTDEASYRLRIDPN